MADDNTLRTYRSNDASRRNSGHGDAHDAPAADPLAELARLIGQTDPFADNPRGNPPGGMPRFADPVPMSPELPAGDWRQHIERPHYESMHDEAAMPADPHFPATDPHGEFHDRDYAAAADNSDQRTYQTEEAYRGGYADERHPDDVEPHAAAALAADARAAINHHGEQAYDDPPGRGRTRSRALVTAVMLFGCAMLGTAGAYGYRTYAAPSAGAKPAPVIVADSAPSKIVPAAAEPKSSRSQDRVGGNGDERLVSREEQPVALGGGSPPRAVFPAPVPQAQAATPPSPPTAPAAAPAAPPAAAGASEPKRIRTVTIRPDGGDSSGRPIGETGSAPSRAAPSARTATPQAPRAPAAAAARGEPLSLDPSAQAQAREPAPAQQRALTPPAPRENSAPATREASRETWEPAPRAAPANGAKNGPKLASVPSNGGGYAVQVSSQRSESDARASYRGLQAKYPQLRARQATIRRAEVGSKGVFYRAMVGPFGSANEADQFCSGLKKAGGQCIILRN